MRVVFTRFVLASLALLPLAAQEVPTPLRPKDNPFSHVRLFAKSPTPGPTAFATEKSPERCGHIRIHSVTPGADQKSILAVSEPDSHAMFVLPGLAPCPAR